MEENTQQKKESHKQVTFVYAYFCLPSMNWNRLKKLSKTVAIALYVVDCIQSMHAANNIISI